MRRIVLTSLRTTLLTLAVTGVLYPLAVTGFARLAFPHRSGG